MDSLIQRWKSTVGSGQKSGSFSSRNGNVIDETTQRNMNTSSNSNYQNDQRDRSLSGKRNEKRGLSASSSSSSSSSELPYSNKRHNQSAVMQQNKIQEDKLDEIFQQSGTKVIEGQNKGIGKTQGIIKPPLKQHQSPSRNTSQDEKSKLKSLRESYANTKANAQININQKPQSQSQILNNNSYIQNINSNTARTQIIASSPSRGMASGAANTNRRSMTFYIDESVFRIVDVFTISKQLDHKEQVSRVRNIIENLVENCKSYYNSQNNRSNSREDQQSQSQIKDTERTLSKIKQTSLAQKADQNSKIVSELENKLFECERARIQLKTENEQQQIKISSLQKEIETIKVTNTMLDMVRESQLLLEKNNKTLHEQLKKEEQKNVEQQRIFESQLQEVQLIIHHLKQQLNQAYSTSPIKQ